MSKNTHTAGFQVSYFLNSKRPFKFKNSQKFLNGNGRSLLRYFADLMDMEFYRSKKLQCTISLSQLAKYSGCSVRTVIELIKKFVRFRMIKIISKPDKSMHTYGIGRWIESYATIAYVGNHLMQPLHIPYATIAQDSQNHMQRLHTSNKKASNNVLNKKQQTSFTQTSKSQAKEEDEMYKLCSTCQRPKFHCNCEVIARNAKSKIAIRKIIEGLQGPTLIGRGK